MRVRRIGWNLLATAFDRLAIAGVQLAMVPLLARAWGLDLYGCWLLLTAVPGFLALADLGFGGAAYVRMLALIARGERDAARGVLHAACRIVGGAGLIASVVVTAAIWLVPAATLPHAAALPTEGVRMVLQLLLLYSLLLLAGSVQGICLSSVGLFAAAAASHGLIFAGENALVAGAVLDGHGPIVAAAALLVGRAVGVAAQAVLLRRRAPWLRPGFSRPAVPVEGLARSAASMLAVPLGQATALQGTVMALGAAAGSAATPAFVAARTLSRIGLQATQLLTHALVPEFATAHAQANTRAQAAMLLAVAGLSVALALPFAGLVALAGDAVLRLWTGGAVVAPAGLMPVIAASIVLGGLWQPLASLMAAIDRQAAFAWAYLLLGAGSLALTFVAARTLGATGAAIGLGALDLAMATVIGRFAWTHWFSGLPIGEVARAARARLSRR